MKKRLETALARLSNAGQADQLYISSRRVQVRKRCVAAGQHITKAAPGLQQRAAKQQRKNGTDGGAD